MFYSLSFILDTHTLNCQTHDVDCREREVASCNRCLLTKAILENSCATTHCRYLILVAFRVIFIPLFVFIICRIKVYEVWEETTSSNLTSELIEVVIFILGQIAYSSFLFPYLNWEYGSRATSYTLVCGLQ